MKLNSSRRGFLLWRGASMLAVLLACSVVFGQEAKGPGGTNEPGLLGTWVYSGATTTWTLQLNEDGSATLRGQVFSYTARGNRLVLVDDKGGVSSHTYFLSGDVLTVAPEGTQRAVKFTRFKKPDDAAKSKDNPGKAGGEPARDSASRKDENETGESGDRSPHSKKDENERGESGDSRGPHRGSRDGVVESPHSKNEEETGLAGRWQSSAIALEIFEDGRLTINGEQFNYRVDGRQVVLSNNEGSIRVEFELDRDTLTTNYQGERTVYRRVRGGAGGGTGNNASLAGDTSNESGSANPAELVGKWCYMSNVTASNGGRMSNTCFTLYPNGTYEYYSETSSSNPYGGTASQSSDGGTWSVSGSTLIANSRSRGRLVYTLEKRNHPKTGDPMLMVDGDAFVTATQRRPW